MKEKMFGLKDFEKFNVVEGLREPVWFFTPWRGTFSIFRKTLNEITCDFDFGWAGAGDLVELFNIDTSKDEISLNFPLKSKDKRAIHAGTIETYCLLGIPRNRMHLIKDRKGRIIFGLPEFEGTKWQGDIYIKIKGFEGIPNLQIALFDVVKNREDRERLIVFPFDGKNMGTKPLSFLTIENSEKFLVFSFYGETMKKALYFLVISVKSLENPYQGIEFFYPQNLEG